MDLVSPYPLWYFLFCILAGAVYAFVLYRKDKKLNEFSTWVIGLLASFRFLAVAIICVLLLSPLVKYFSRTVEKPIIIVAIDNSASMKMNVDTSNGLNASIAQLQEKLGQNYDLAFFLFDQELTPQDSAADFEGDITNFQELFSAVSDRFVNRNVGGMVLISDGIYNQGSNPIYLTDRLTYPIYTVAAGDSNKIKDAKVAQLRNNKIAFLGNSFPLEMDIKLEQAKGEKVGLRVIKDGQVIYSESVSANSEDFLKTIATTLEAKKVGIQKYTVEVTALDAERNLQNNSLNFYIDVLDGRQKIALLGVSPHPDLAAIKRSIEINENYELTSGLLADMTELKDYDLVILHNSTIGDQKLVGNLKRVVESQVPLLIIGNGWDALGAQFGIRAIGGRQQSQRNETFPVLNDNFSLFTISENLKKQLNRFPPLNGFSTNVDNKNLNTTLFYQKIGAVPTKFPLLVFYEKDKRKVGRLFADGLWRWSINDFVENQNHENFNELIGKTVQYLAIKSDRSNFRVHTANEYFENEEIVFDAQLFNDSYELINDEEVDLKLLDEDKKVYEYVFNRNKLAYQLSVGALPAGKYNYEASTVLQGKKHKEFGTFTVKELQLEQMETVADHNLLYQLAEKSGGELVYPNNMQQINDLLAARTDINSVSYVSEEVEDLINIRWIFFVIAGLFVLEWFLRKRNGAY